MCSYLAAQLSDSDSYESAQSADGTADGVLAFAIITALLSGLVAIADGHLIVYHIWLKAKGLTTFEHIISRRSDSAVQKQNIARYIIKPDQEVKSEGDESTAALVSPSQARTKVLPMHIENMQQL
jgi:hypothetical protein